MATVTGVAIADILQGRPILGPQPRQPPDSLCGAYWYRGFAIQPYEVTPKAYGWIVRGGNGATVAPHNTTEATAKKALGAAIHRVDAMLPDPYAMWQASVYEVKNANKTIRVWGDGVLPDDVDDFFCAHQKPNWIWLAPDCSKVVEGPYFEPLSLGLQLDAQVASTHGKTLDLSPTNSVYGYVDYLLEHQTLDALEVAERVAKQLGCPVTWAQDDPGQGIKRWIFDFAGRINTYVAESGGIYFDPLGAG